MCSLEVSNEDWKNGQLAGRFDAALFKGVLATRSAPSEEQFPDGPGPLLDFTVHHTPRDPGWMRQANDLIEVARLGWTDRDVGSRVDRQRAAGRGDRADSDCRGHDGTRARRLLRDRGSLRRRRHDPRRQSLV